MILLKVINWRKADPFASVKICIEAVKVDVQDRF